MNNIKYAEYNKTSDDLTQSKKLKNALVMKTTHKAKI